MFELNFSYIVGTKLDSKWAIIIAISNLYRIATSLIIKVVINTRKIL